MMRTNGPDTDTGYDPDTASGPAPDNGRAPARPRVYWSRLFDLAVAPSRRFPHTKYRLLRETLLAEAIVPAAVLHTSPLAARADLLRAHDAHYVDAILSGNVADTVMRRIGFTWTDALPERSRASVGGSLAAARCALQSGFAAQLAGGTHHAHRDFGSGYCVFNDHAVAALTLLEECRVKRVAILDLDVHQGDGNAAILRDDPRVLAVSVHGARNFPFRKVPGDLDLALPDGVGDSAYLEAVDSALSAVLAFRPDLLLYQAGVDALACDRLGRLAVSHAGLRERDRRVFSAALAAAMPLAMALGGGYGEPIAESVEAYANTYRMARRIYGF